MFLHRRAVFFHQGGAFGVVFGLVGEQPQGVDAVFPLRFRLCCKQRQIRLRGGGFLSDQVLRHGIQQHGGGNG